MAAAARLRCAAPACVAVPRCSRITCGLGQGQCADRVHKMRAQFCSGSMLSVGAALRLCQILTRCQRLCVCVSQAAAGWQAAPATSPAARLCLCFLARPDRRTAGELADGRTSRAKNQLVWPAASKTLLLPRTNCKGGSKVLLLLFTFDEIIKIVIKQ